MADSTHLDQLRSGAASWNAWVAENAPSLKPDLHGADLRGADLRGYNLTESNLSLAILDGADLRDALLDFANLSEASLNEANLANARLFFVDLSDAQCRGTDFSQTRLTGIKMRNTAAQGARFDRAHFEVAELLHGHFEGAHFRGTLFTAGHTMWCDFTKGDLKGMACVDTRMEGCVLAEASLQHAVVRRGEFNRCDFRGAKLARSEFLACRFQECDLRDVQAQGARLRRCRLPQCSVTGAHFEETDFRGSNEFAFDRNTADGVELSRKCSEPWTMLSREYTIGRLWLHLLLAAIFFAPLGQRALLYMTLVPAGYGSAERWPLWKLLLGYDLGTFFPLTGSCLLAYAVLRITMTQAVSILQEQQRQTGHTPYLSLETARRHGQPQAIEPSDLPPPLPGMPPPEEPLPPPVLLWLRHRGEAYGWLRPPHYLTRLLLFVSLAGFCVSLSHWLMIPVAIP
ncbi:MAG: pentapeptide repeat-containing protein [Candidatus Hydrogenedentes bacterium]|nr:pentapeptide repeat-containing protein [Candidatus Hydrogenedentota bacterium]